MNRKILAALASAVLLLNAAGCSKMTEVTSSPDSVPVSTTMAGETAPDGTNAADSAANRETAADGTDTADTNADAPVNADGETQPVTPSADDDQEGEYGTAPVSADSKANADAPAPDAAKPKADNASAKLHVTIETVDVSLDELKAQDYTVPLVVTLDKNPGITYSEWGLKLDSRCTYTTDSKGLDFSTVSFINDEKHFLWTAWTSGAQVTDYDGSLLKLNVKLPMDAKSGDSYQIAYADVSLADAAHIWVGGDNDWVKSGQVGWTDGGVNVK